MNAQEARKLTNQTRQEQKISSYFDCLIAIRQACKEGHDSVVISTSISSETADKLMSEGYQIESRGSKINSGIIITW